jgi:hypothetical protein
LIKEQKIEREPYTGEIIEIKSVANGDSKISPKNQANHINNNNELSASGFHNRPATRAG